MKAKIFKAAEADWIEAPGHHSAFSKLFEDLIFVVAASPPRDMPRPQ